MDKRDLSSLDASRPIDDRWTESKLVRAGYKYTGDGKCRYCGEMVSFYKREPPNPVDRVRWMVMDEGSLGNHECRGR